MKTGIMLVNTGTADAPTEDAIRAYLAEFMMDGMLFETNRFIWKHVVKHAILPKRPAETKWRYEAVWTPEGSKFMVASREQTRLVAQELARRNFAGGKAAVTLSMRYGNPSIMTGLRDLRDAACERVIVVPMYPQYVNVCAGTVLAEVDRCMAVLTGDGWNPQLVKVRHFYDSPAYIKATAEAIRSKWEWAPGKHMVFSWHSTMMKDIDEGDPYNEQCLATAAAVATELGIPEDSYTVAFNSRFDTRKWLGPYLEPHTVELAHAGVTDLCVHCPGFVADNIENLVEIDMELRSEYLKAAHEAGHDDARFTFVSALNGAPGLIEAVCDAIEKAVA